MSLASITITTSKPCPFGGLNIEKKLIMIYRQKSPPLNVLILEAGFPLVQVDGKRLDTLREDFFDQGAGAYSKNPPAIVSAYDIALCGGEPYSNWS